MSSDWLRLNCNGNLAQGNGDKLCAVTSVYFANFSIPAISSLDRMKLCYVMWYSINVLVLLKQCF